MRKSINQILTEYGSIALVVYFSIFFAVLAGSWMAIHLGWQPETAVGTAGTFMGAYVATKVSQPLRIAVTLVVTPLAARVINRFELFRRFRPARVEAESVEPR